MRKLGTRGSGQKTEQLTEQRRQDAERPEQQKFKIARLLHTSIPPEDASSGPTYDPVNYTPESDKAKKIASESIAVQNTYWKDEARKALELRINGSTGGHSTPTSGSVSPEKYPDVTRDSNRDVFKAYTNFLAKSAKWVGVPSSGEAVDFDALRKSMGEQNEQRLREARKEIDHKRKAEVHVNIDPTLTKRAAGTVAPQELNTTLAAKPSEQANSPKRQTPIDRPRGTGGNSR